MRSVLRPAVFLSTKGGNTGLILLATRSTPLINFDGERGSRSHLLFKPAFMHFFNTCFFNVHVCLHFLLSPSTQYSDTLLRTTILSHQHIPMPSDNVYLSQLIYASIKTQQQPHVLRSTIQ